MTDALGFAWGVLADAGKVITPLLMVVLYFMDRIWAQRFNGLEVRVADLEETDEEQREKVQKTSEDVAVLVSRTDEIKGVLDTHVKEERSFWGEMRRFMLHQGYNGGDQG